MLKMIDFKDESSAVPVLKSFASLQAIVGDLKPNPVRIGKENSVMIRRVLRAKLREEQEIPRYPALRKGRPTIGVGADEAAVRGKSLGQILARLKT